MNTSIIIFLIRLRSINNNNNNTHTRHFSSFSVHHASHKINTCDIFLTEIMCCFIFKLHCTEYVWMLVTGGHTRSHVSSKEIEILYFDEMTVRYFMQSSVVSWRRSTPTRYWRVEIGGDCNWIRSWWCTFFSRFDIQ